MRSDSLIGYRLEIRITYSNVALKRVNGELFPSRQLKKKAYIPYPKGIGVLRHSYKKDIKLRDGNKCLNPTCNKRDSRLNIHHIDYNKKNCEYKNVITLCGSCNSSANKDREWHTAWYQALMYMRYNYKYSKLKGELNE